MPTAVIIGAGPAGSLSALLLARAGWSVTLIEQHRFPRDKVCGECLSATGMDVLARARIADFPSDAIELKYTLIHASDGSSCRVELPRPMWGLSRHVLDNHLLERARAAGVEIRQPVRCESLTPHLIVRDLLTNRLDHLSAHHVIVADGKPMGTAHPTGDFGIKTHFTGVNGPRDAIELFGVNGSYGGLAAIEGDRWNAAFSVPAARLRSFNGNVQALFDQMMNENLVLQKRLHRAKRIAPWLSSPLPRSAVAARWPDGVIPIGNAAAALEPIGGEGMGLALRSAELAASALIQAHQHGVRIDLDRLRADYHRLWRTRSAACRAAALAVSCKSIASWLSLATDGCESLTRAAMSLMGKSA
jgi:flavin-dependent dehydrogenase